MPANPETAAWTMGRVQQWTSRHFAQRGIESARLDADLVLAHALGLERIHVYAQFDKPLNPSERKAIRALVRRRAAREPLAYITGRKEFYGLPIEVSPDVLIPRPETEHLVEAALGWIRDRPNALLLDLGTGSGCIPMAILANAPGARAVAVDLSQRAREMAQRNAQRLGLADRLSLMCGDWFSPVAGRRFDAITANPPYIPAGEIDALAPEVSRWEPRSALDGGPDGLSAIRVILQQAMDHLAVGGRLFMEIGAEQAEAVSAIARSAGWRAYSFVHDYAGIPRVAALERG